MKCRQNASKTHAIYKKIVLVGIGVTNRGGCASSRSLGSPLYLGNLKAKERSAPRRAQESVFMYIRNKAHSFPSCFRSLPLCFTPSSWLRNRGFVSPYSGSGRGLFANTGPVLFTGSGGFRGLFTGGFKGLCLRLVIQLKIWMSWLPGSGLPFL